MDDIGYWLALQRIPGLGPVACRALLKHYSGHPRLLFADAAGASPALAARLPAPLLRALATPDWAAVERDLAWLERPDRHALALPDPRYPPLLKQIHDAPPVLYVRGRVETLGAPQLAIVGSRSASPGGLDIARDFAAALGRCGLAITSGLAIGIDGAAHRGALEAAAPTIAVAATGPDLVYPARHRALAEEIAAGGALVTEFPPGHPPLPGSFPRRNRIISGLSLGTLVVEAAPGSGSLITARAALEQGREVFAVPGSIHNPRARGCHALIRQGAKLVECTEDILEELAPLFQAARTLGATAGKPETAAAAPDATAAYVLARIDYAPTTLDTLIERTGLGAEQLHHILLDLELANHITSAPGSAYLRRQTEV
jgi:DNA processing protein